MSNPLHKSRVVTTFALAGASIALLAGSAAHGKKLFIPRVPAAASSTEKVEPSTAAPAQAAAPSETENAPSTSAAAPGVAPGSEPAAPQAMEAAPAPGAAPATQRTVKTAKPAKPVPGPETTAAAIAASRAEAEKVDRAGDEGIDDSRDVVKPVLAKHPDSNLVICVAGCGSEPQIVQILPRPPEKTESRVVPSSSGEDEPAVEQPTKKGDNAIVCIAGCKGKRGEVIYRRGRVSWIEPDSDAIRRGLREIAERLSTELRVIATAEQAQTLTTWSGMGRSVMEAGNKSRTFADASAAATWP